MVIRVLMIIASYLMGSVSSARLIAGIKGVDLNIEGTRNPGATNVYKLISPFWGIVTGWLDFCKGFIPVYIGKEILNFNMIIVILVAAGAIAGHNWPVLFSFRGGRGLATSMGTLGAVCFIPGFISFIIGGALTWISRRITDRDLRIPFFVYPVFIIIIILYNFNIYLIGYAVTVFILACFRAWQVNRS